MKQLTCEMCGSTDMLKQDGVFVCQSCGCKYSVEEAKKLMIEGTVEVKGTVKVDSSNEVNNLLKRAFMFLEEGNWVDANEYCERALDIAPENARAYLGLLMKDLNVKKQEDLKNYVRPFDDNKNYQKAVQFADEALKKTLIGYIEHIKTNPTATTIGVRAFEGRGDLTSYVIPNGVTTIGDYAFYGCENLRSISIPNSVTTIGKGAFSYCPRLTSITIPDSVTTIRDDAFSLCGGLTSVTIGKSVTTIGSGAFAHCEKLTSVIIPDSVRTIGTFAFKKCIQLSYINIPSRVSEIGSGAFESYVSISVDCGNPYFEIRNRGIPSKKGIYDKGLYDKRNENLILFCSIDSKNSYGNASTSSSTTSSSGGCYVATCVYGSYDCPQVWTLRRFRDNTLASTWYGRAFIKIYYTISPTLVKWFGETKWFKNMWKGKLDRMVANLQSEGVESTPYEDRNW